MSVLEKQKTYWKVRLQLAFSPRIQPFIPEIKTHTCIWVAFSFQAILRHVYDIRVYSCCLSFLYHAWVAITPAFFKPVHTKTIVLRFQKAPLREGKSTSAIVSAWKYDESAKNPVHLQATNAFLWTGLGIYFMKRGKGGLVDVCLTEIPVKNLNANTAVSSRYSLLKEREETDVFADYLWESYRF